MRTLLYPSTQISAYSAIADTAKQYVDPTTYIYMQASGLDGSIVAYTYDTNGKVTSINRK